MKLNDKQIESMQKMADALISLTETWTDEVGNILTKMGLLPKWDLMEAAFEFSHMAITGEIKDE